MSIEKFNTIMKLHGMRKYLKRWKPASLNVSIEESIQSYHMHSFIEENKPKAISVYNAPIMKLSQNKIAYIEIKTDHEKVSSDVNTFLDSAFGIKGLIIDFRKHLGGSFWPVVDCFKRYLKNTSLIKFNDYWINEEKGKIVFNSKFHSDVNIRIPIAVIIGPKTKSSGEISAAIFKGRPNCKLFGNKTFGKLSCNQPFILDKKHTLWLTTAIVTTYDKELHVTETLFPDFVTNSPLVDAKRWILSF